MSALVSAGETPLLNVFKTGVVLVLISEASGKTLRTKDNGEVEGKGGEGTMAQFTVHVRGQQRVALQNVNNPRHWLRIKDNDLNGKGQEGGGFTEFKLEEHNNRVVFESVKCPGEHVGVLESGDAKKPRSTGTGRHSQFQPKVIQEVRGTITAGTSCYEKLLAHGNVVVLQSVASGRSLRAHDDGNIDGTGGTGLLAHFIVHVVGEHTIKLQCKKSQERWLQMRRDSLHTGKGGRTAEFKVDSHEGHLVLESVKFPGNHVGVMENGALKAPNRTRRDRPGQFRVDVLAEQPSYHRAGTSLLQRTLYHGNVVVLYSRASGRTLKINDNNSIDGQGGEGALALFMVHVRAPGVVAFQHVRQPNLYLSITPAQLTHTGGNSECNFKVKEKDNHLVFESEEYAGRHVGVLPGGELKSPSSTGDGVHGQFLPKVKAESRYGRRK